MDNNSIELQNNNFVKPDNILNFKKTNSELLMSESI